MRHTFNLGSILLLCVVVLFWGCEKKSANEVDLSPANWPEGELEKFTKLNQSMGKPKPFVEGENGMIAGTSAALAVRAGMEALKQGGSAVDAALATSIAQIVLSAGSEISYSGFMTMVHYEASTGKVETMNAAYNTVQDEKDPMTIPFLGKPSGRAALVPGFFAGVQAAHDRFGKIPFAKLFEPAIYFAEKGFLLDEGALGFMDPSGYRETIWNRHPGINKVFTKANGEFYTEGDIFKQPLLAETLKKVAANGADYMYTGEWAKKLVEAIQAEGSKMTLKDLEDYKVIWSDPLHSAYKDFDVFTLDSPNYGGANTIEALNLLEASNLSELGHYITSPEAFFWLTQISQAWMMLGPPGIGSGLSPAILKKLVPEGDISLASRVKKEHAQQLWKKIKEAGGLNKLIQALIKPEPRTNHSAGVVAVDALGNVVTIVHTINTVSWGTTGIFVDGVSVNDSASFQQPVIDHVGPGARLPEPTCPVLVLKDGKPYLASSTIGTGLLQETLQVLHDILDFGFDPKKAVDSPKFGSLGHLTLDLLSGNPMNFIKDMMRQSIREGDFSDEFIEAVEAMGQRLAEQPRNWRGSISSEGYWIGILIDPKTGRLLGGADAMIEGCAIGY